MHFETKCTCVSFVILRQNALNKISLLPMGTKFWGNDQNCLLGSYSWQWHHLEPNPSTQFSSTVFRIFLKMEKLRLMRFAMYFLSCKQEWNARILKSDIFYLTTSETNSLTSIFSYNILILKIVQVTEFCRNTGAQLSAKFFHCRLQILVYFLGAYISPSIM